MPRAGIAREEKGDRSGLKYHSGEVEEAKIDRGYQEFANRILSSMSEKDREAMTHVLSSKKAMETYHIMKEQGLPPATMREIMIDGANDIARERDISVGTYLVAVGNELKRHEKYIGVVDAMYEDHVLSERQYSEIQGSVKKKSSERIKQVSRLEGLAKAAVWIMMLVGGLLMLFSSSTITGNVIGAHAGQPFMFVIGFVLFVIGLMVNVRNR